MVTELVTFKMDSVLLAEVDKTVKAAGFQNRTELIRASLREKVDEVKLKAAMRALSKFRGISHKNITDEQIERVREEVFDEIKKGFKQVPRA